MLSRPGLLRLTPRSNQTLCVPNQQRRGSGSAACAACEVGAAVRQAAISRSAQLNSLSCQFSVVLLLSLCFLLLEGRHQGCGMPAHSLALAPCYGRLGEPPFTVALFSGHSWALSLNHLRYASQLLWLTEFSEGWHAGHRPRLQHTPAR